MFEINGKFATAKVFTDDVDNETVGQILGLLNQDFVQGCKVRIMPDCHKGSGCVIGFTANLGSRVIPNLVGVDIGCGMTAVELGKRDIRFNILDEVIRELVPSGFNMHKRTNYTFPFSELFCWEYLKADVERFTRQIGTLGGGNHFIELDVDSQGEKYLVIHSGSRNMGLQIANLYQDLAIDRCKGLGDLKEMEQEVIKTMKQNGRQNEIQNKLQGVREKFRKAQPLYQKDLCFLSGKDRDNYLHDMKIAQNYAAFNRYRMASIIVGGYLGEGLANFNYWQTVHNYINFQDNIIRKGAVSANAGEKLIIPMNMRDGSLICIGLGNEDWNNSAPHGAGRLFSRTKAKSTFTMEEFQREMGGIYSTSINPGTLDESPMAYKPMDSITKNIDDTVKIVDVIKPLYNFKAGEK